MTADPRSWIARRPLLAGALGVAGIGIAGAFLFELPEIARPRYPATPYDDLLRQLDDRESAIRLGGAVVAEQPDFDADKQADLVRRELGGRPLGGAIDADLARGRLMEIQGWLVPRSLGLVAGIAAKAQIRPARA